MSTPLITIITACWRVENLKKIIECVDGQTYQNFQHLLINDNNPEVRDVFKDLCDGITRHWIDCGVRCHAFGGVARNIGVAVAFSYIRERDRNLDTEFIIFLDDDNLWEPNHLQTFIDVLQEHPEATMIGSDMIKIGVNDTNWRLEIPCRIKHGHCDLGSFLYKATLFRTYGFFWPRPRRKHRFDIELIEKMYQGEKDNTYFTGKSTFLMSYRKK